MKTISTADGLSRFFKIFAVEARVRIVELLKNGPLCVNSLAKELAMTPAGVSQHLRILRAANFVVPNKQGNFVHYSLNGDAIRRSEELVAHFFGLGR